MPELPEVQTIVNDLNKKIAGDTIVDFSSEWPKAIKNVKLPAFKKAIIGAKIKAAHRIGKNIFIDLSNEKTIYIHLKMTGHLLVKYQVSSIKYKAKEKDYFDDRVNQYIRHRWTLKGRNGKIKSMDFSDVRKFAKIVLTDTDKIKEIPEIKALGIDAMSPEFTFKKFNEILEKKKNMPIGLLLMDQSTIAGIGNIYRSEILFEAGILPGRKVASLSGQERIKLYKSIKKIMEKAIKLRGTSDSDYRDTAGAPGGFQKVLRVYRKQGEKCQKCGTIVIRKAIGQRSAFFCPACQK